MSRKENIADYETSLKNSFERWDHLNKYGGSEQGTPCGEKQILGVAKANFTVIFLASCFLNSCF